VDQFSLVYLPSSLSNFSILMTFILLLGVLVTKPTGLFGRPA
jgi:hypothetical protein